MMFFKHLFPRRRRRRFAKHKEQMYERGVASWSLVVVLLAFGVATVNINGSRFGCLVQRRFTCTRVFLVRSSSERTISPQCVCRLSLRAGA